MKSECVSCRVEMRNNEEKISACVNVTVCVCVFVNPRVDMHTLCLNEVCLGGK